jgi:hypothetical protein
VPFNARLFHGELHTPKDRIVGISDCPGQGQPSRSA